MKKIINLFILCGIILLGVCGCSNNKITNDKEINKNEEVKEDIDIKENETDTKDNDTNEDVNLDSKEDTKPTISNNNSNNTSTTNDEKQEITVKQENTTNKEDTKQESFINNNIDKKEENIIGTWLYDNGAYVYIFNENKLTIINTSINSIKENNYKIEENRLIINENNNTEFEIKDNILYLGRIVLKKADSNYIYPSIYYNYDAFYGTWKLESEVKTIMLENNTEKTLNDEMIITKNNVSGYGSCGGVGCKSYLINFTNTKPELYTGNLCFELVDKNTLNQIKCQNDTIMGYSGWETQTIHNIIYKRVN